MRKKNKKKIILRRRQKHLMNIMKQTIQNYDIKWNLLNVTPLAALRLPNNRAAQPSIGNHRTHIHPSGHPYNRYAFTQHTSGTGSELPLECLRRNVRRNRDTSSHRHKGYFAQFTHSVVCLATGLQPLPKRFLQRRSEFAASNKGLFLQVRFHKILFLIAVCGFCHFYILAALASLLRHCSKFAPTVALLLKQGCGVAVGVVESDSEGILGGVGVGVGVGVDKNIPTPNPTLVQNLN
jgi:hypothetical protein